jgi:hypothetical protein
MSATADGLADQHHAPKEREIQEVSVIFLIGVYYLTKDQQEAVRQTQADSRITDLEAHRQIDAMVVDGHYKEADVDDNGTVTRGKVHVPVELGMRQIADKY